MDVVFPSRMITAKLVYSGADREVVEISLDVNERFRLIAYEDGKLLLFWRIVLVSLALLLHLEPSRLYKLHPGSVAEYPAHKLHHRILDHIVSMSIFNDHAKDCIILVDLSPKLPREVVVAFHWSVLLF